MKGKIVVIDDDHSLLQYLKIHFENHQYSVSIFQNPTEALKSLGETPVDLVLTDVKMPELTGDEVLNHIKQYHEDTGVIMMTGFGSIEHGVHAIQKGAFDYITKPFQGPEILARVNRFFKVKEQTGSTRVQSHGFTGPKHSQSAPNKTSDAEKSEVDVKMVGNHPKITQLLEALPQIATNNAPVLIQGESGTGKEVFASLIHYNSDRADKPYIKINCANLPRELVESTLFGHVKGAFTGAISDTKGAFDEANGGTLLLDEITEIEISVQAKLLRVLQEKEFRRVGSQQSQKVDVRIIATSNRNIGEAIAEKEFREDLYFRLNVFPIYIPPLRERRDDIDLLVAYFVSKFSAEYGMPIKEVNKELMNYLHRQEWKGNVRELSNLVQRGVLMAGKEDEINLSHIKNMLFSYIDDDITTEKVESLPLIPIEEMELKLIRQALERTNGNQKEAAELLGISDRTIRNKLKKIRIDE